MAKQIRADIVIGGQADSTLFALGDSIEQLGRQVNMVSQALIDFGKESVTNYQDYEDAMLDAQYALATSYTNAADLGRVMAELSKNALQWAQDSRFTTVDVANAIDEAAHAGWNLEEILAGIPAAMKIALAGGMDLSEGLSMMIKIANAAGLSFDELGDFTDLWAYAANSSATDISEMGEAMQKMGATMQFVGGDMAALTTMLAMLADNGATGTEAGTLLRNSLIRLIAPTQKAADAMSGLALSGEDLDEIYADADAVAKAGELLQEAGFSAYDAEGNLKSVLTIWEELAAATSGMTDENRNTVLSAIFPTRTITGAMALLNAAANGWNGLYDAMNAGAEGYAAYGALLLESGMGGALRHLESVVDATKTKTGEALSGDVTYWANAFSGFLENLNNMDPAAFQGLVGGLEIVAGAGTGLITAGIAVKGLSMIFGTGPYGWLALAGIGMAALAKGVLDYGEAVAEADFEDQFGGLSYDESKLGQYMAALSEGYSKTAQSIEEYNKQVATAFGDYETYSGSMKSTLLTQLITHSELTEEDKTNLYGLGQKMQEAIVAGIGAKQSSSGAALEMLMGTEGVDASNPIWASIMATLESGFGEAKSRAESLGQELRAALTSAFSDNQLSQDEIDNIQSLMDQMNEIEAQMVAANDAASRERLIQKGQTLGLEGLASAASIAYTYRDQALAELEDLYLGDDGLYATSYLMASRQVAAGTMTQEQMDAQMAAITAAYNMRRTSTSAGYDQALASMYDSVMRGSTFGDAWRMMLGMTGDGVVTADEYSQFYSSAGLTNIRQIAQTMGMLINDLGGYENIMSLRDTFAAAGNTEMSGFYNQILANYAMAMAGSEAQTEGGIGNWLQLLGVGNGEGGVTVPVEADVSAAQETINGLNGQTITVNVDGVSGADGRHYAEGGRAVTASIFGEAGPEWAIPEEHSQRTAELLYAAAKASGFTWPELLSRNGGLNAGAGSWTLVYSPTIQAADAGGIEQKLREDKDRLERWLRDQRLRDEIEVYA